MKFYLVFIFLLTACLSNAQWYQSELLGNSSDKDTISKSGALLAGGGTDNDDAMTWFLEQANGGDVVVIRSDASFAYNPYLYSQLGVTVNSVETIVIPSAYAANSQYVTTQLSNAEAIFIAGGDQTEYYDIWKNTAVDSIVGRNSTSDPVIGGTSAGMVVLGDYDYYPQQLGVTSSEALSNPYHPNMDSITKEQMIERNELDHYIFDTHFDQESRAGRFVTMIARAMEIHNAKILGLAVNEFTAVAVNSNGIGKVFGEHPNYQDFAYFVQPTCPLTWINYMPETMMQDTALTWNYNNKILKVYKVPGTAVGNGSIDVDDLSNSTGGSWYYWYVINGILEKTPLNSEPDCFDDLSVNDEQKNDFEILNYDQFYFNTQVDQVRVFDLQGKKLLQKSTTEHLDLSQLKSGMYIIRYNSNGTAKSTKWVQRP